MKRWEAGAGSFVLPSGDKWTPELSATSRKIAELKRHAPQEPAATAEGKQTLRLSLWHRVAVKPKTVLVFGAGFSKPAGGPLLRELFEPAYVQLSGAAPDVLYALADLTAKNGDTHAIEQVFTEIWREARTKGTLNFGGNSVRAEHVWRQLTLHLTAVCARIRLRRNSNLWRTYASYLYNTYETSRSLDVVTFNYDLLAEQLLDDLNIRYGYGDVRDLELNDGNRRGALKRYGADVQVLKVHGSANWGYCEACPKADDTSGLLVAYEDAYVPTSRRRTCPYCNTGLLEPGIVPPVVGKAGEIRGMAGVWGHARKVLKRADKVVVIGYSLPAADYEAVSLLREATSAKVIIVCGPDGAPPSYRQLFPQLQDARMYGQQFFGLDEAW